MKTIVTGGAGFLGSHLCDLRLDKGHKVICIDNLVTGSAKNIKHIDSDKFTYLKHGVTKPIYFVDNIDHIFHLAPPASPSTTLTSLSRRSRSGHLAPITLKVTAKGFTAKSAVFAKTL